ncbi:branched-chain amino acid ABC transporter permease [Methylobacterium frigidaeris]|uniref:High-affinity branched-chain amino acid transport system permease protein LivH n=1 Tax=Methylobacterium frigidaeris TaxID=2038277 RepID=A0AA37M691_9HYPH|nr:branched-chain amino acid ABC transporter permease [Methylobacterium frigidaeris]GJD64478.1 High-affinity branched-chain amino acid transport system permease protein LivH [Methylobacterium frigidaeris]
MNLALQFLANGLVTGAFYALSALGLTLIFGLMRVVNFAHGEFFMLGGVLGWVATAVLGLDFATAFVLVVAAMGVLGWLVDRFMIERVRGHGEESTILLTIGLSIFLANATLYLAGPAPMKVPAPLTGKPLFLGPVVLTKSRLAAVAVSVVLVLGAYLVIHRTRIGRAMRATFQDAMAAKLSGIRTERIFAATFALGTMLAASAGMLLASIYSAQASVGGLVSLKAFVVVILGGMGSFPGAIAGGLILGLSEAFWGGYVSTGTVDIVGFVMVILILLFRPRGLFSLNAQRA